LQHFQISCPRLARQIGRQEEKARSGGREFVKGSEIDWHDNMASNRRK
jgi:hypothetical protein